MLDRYPTLHIPISRELAAAIMCEVKFRQSDWYKWNMSPHDKRIDRNMKRDYERAERRRAFVLDMIRTAK